MREQLVGDRARERLEQVEAASLIHTISTGRRFNLLEALAGTIADELLSHFEVSRARVRVRKPEVKLGLPVEFTAATVERTAR